MMVHYMELKEKLVQDIQANPQNVDTLIEGYFRFLKNPTDITDDSFFRLVVQANAQYTGILVENTTGQNICFLRGNSLPLDQAYALSVTAEEIELAADYGNKEKVRSFLEDPRMTRVFTSALLDYAKLSLNDSAPKLILYDDAAPQSSSSNTAVKQLTKTKLV